MSESTRGPIAPPGFTWRLKLDGEPGGEDLQRSHLLRRHHLWIR